MNLSRKILIFLLVVPLLAGAAYAYYSFEYMPAQAAPTQALQTARVRTGDIRITASGSGNLVSATEIRLGFRSSGSLTELNAVVGEEVQSGQVLARVDDTSARIQLEQARLNLEGAPQGVSPEQAANLLPLWQAMKSLSGTSTTAEVELTSVQNQIIETMTPEQLSAIAEMKITNNKLSEFYAEFGIVMPTPVPGVTKVPGSGSGVSQADKEATRAAAQALGTPVGSGAGQAAKTLLYDKVIELLTLRVAE